MGTNCKSSPLKTRPIIYVRDIQELQQRSEHYEEMSDFAAYNPIDDQLQDLSLKRKASNSFVDYVVSAKSELVLNLSNELPMVSATSPSDNADELPLYLSGSSVMLSPNAESHFIMQYRHNNVNMRSLTANTSGGATYPYQSAAGCLSMTAYWNTYQTNISAMFPPTPSSVASSASPRSNCSYQHITSPLSPSPELISEPEDLPVGDGITLPAVCHIFDEAQSASASCFSASSINSQSNSTSSSSNNGPSSNSLLKAKKSYNFKCEQCHKIFCTSKFLSKHQKFHCPSVKCHQEKKKHTCQDCGKIYTSKGALTLHIRTHTLPCMCTICGKAFSRPWLLQKHILTHTHEKPYQCPECTRTFADRSNLRAHQQTHLDVKKYCCMACHKSFSRKSALMKHVSSNCTTSIA